MASEDKLSPEEKLLKIIQQGGAAEKAKAGSARAPAAAEDASGLPAVPPVSEEAVPAAKAVPAPAPAPAAVPKVESAVRASRSEPERPAGKPATEVTSATAGKPGEPAPAPRAAVKLAAAPAVPASAAPPPPMPASEPAAAPMAGAGEPPEAEPVQFDAGSGKPRAARAIRGMVSFFSGWSVSIGWVNRAALVVVLVLVVFVVLAIFTGGPKAEAFGPLPGSAPDVAGSDEPPGGAQESGLLEKSAYLEAAARRNVFVPFGQEQAIDPQPQPEAGIADLRLIGVSWQSEGDRPPEAIIRDLTTQNTYFVKQGEQIGATGLTLERVYRDRVIVLNQEEELELR